MSQNKEKTYKEPSTEIEILNAQNRIARWSARKIIELEEKLAALDRKRVPKPRKR